MRFLIFGTVFILVMAAANYYIYRRFFRLLTPAFARYAMVIPAILMAGEVFFVLDAIFGIIPDSPALYLITSSFIGITFMLFVVTTIYDLVVTISRRVPFDESRRRSIKVLFDVTMLIAAFSYLFKGLVYGLKAPITNTVQVDIADFPFAQYTIIQLSDVHVGRTIKRDFVEQLVERTNGLHPDMVVITGDLIDLPIERIRHDLEPLKEIDAPCYFILGNHEYFHGPNDAINLMRELGITPLLNECISIGEGDKRFNLVGITDLVGERMGLLPHDLEAAFCDVEVDRPCLVLAHQPKTISLLEDQRCDLMLSGHTHGGQIFPFGLLVMIDQPYLAGLYQHDETRQIFVSRGTGYWGPPLRVLSPSEISQIVIKSA